jgi:hypothetical protein
MLIDATSFGWVQFGLLLGLMLGVVIAVSVFNKWNRGKNSE